MLTDFHSSFTGRLSGKFATNSYLNIPPHLNYVATLPCEISMFKNRHAQEVIEANCHVRLSHSGELSIFEDKRSYDTVNHFACNFAKCSPISKKSFTSK